MTLHDTRPDARNATTPPLEADGAAVDARARPRRRRRRRTVALLLGAPVLVVVLAWAALELFRPHLYSGTIMQAPAAAPSMDGLVWSDGTAVDLGAFDGDVVLVYFGYTYCPDVCPTTLSQVARAIDQVDDPERVHVMMVSVDPVRDERAALGDYVRAFDPSFRGATGAITDIERVASTYGVFFARGEDTGGGGYTVDHTATLMGIDTEGHLRIVWPAVLDVDALAADLEALL
ncbi:MAG: SCO family protein [Ilumatobacter sp.]|uniref:SCO family protein n=1 Tax=Ilumatobacter sp. TaxID=1967498 RepID=UPI00260A7D43|nr:SCO family protein [Ilumatobacter sp.]MDJ0767575.1 SCO family protein [Ilumatobacter sp.]